jgi:hypothetical protein
MTTRRYRFQCAECEHADDEADLFRGRLCLACHSRKRSAPARSQPWPLGLWLVLGGSVAGFATLLYLAAVGALLLAREAWRAWE